MSAFIVEDQTIHDVVTAWIKYAKRPIDANTLGRDLLCMNVSAVYQRYGDSQERNEALGEALTYTWQPSDVPEAQLAKSADCLVYQCAEGGVVNWIEFKALEALAQRIPVDRESPAYITAEWAYWGVAS